VAGLELATLPLPLALGFGLAASDFEASPLPFIRSKISAVMASMGLATEPEECSDEAAAAACSVAAGVGAAAAAAAAGGGAAAAVAAAGCGASTA